MGGVALDAIVAGIGLGPCEALHAPEVNPHACSCPRDQPAWLG